MTFETILFYAVAALLVFASLMVITSRNPVRAVLFLVLAFFASSFLWMMLEAEFLAIVLVLVYVGAVMVLFLFVVMMLDINIATIKARFIEHLPAALLISTLLIGQILWILGPMRFGGGETAFLSHHTVDYSSTKQLGEALYTHYVYAFELAGALLLVAIVAAISLTFRGAKARKQQDPGAQARVRKADRLQVIKMSAEKKS
jgi:NADH-quinone oxidoreductase subunit J